MNQGKEGLPWPIAVLKWSYVNAGNMLWEKAGLGM